MHGHVTGSFAGVATKISKGGDKHNSLSQRIDLTKLNPNRHMNYSIIFTEISFYTETSILSLPTTEFKVEFGIAPVTSKEIVK